MENMIPRAEYPRPQLVRDSYLCLNGKWMFEIDHGNPAVQESSRMQKH